MYNKGRDTTVIFLFSDLLYLFFLSFLSLSYYLGNLSPRHPDDKRRGCLRPPCGPKTGQRQAEKLCGVLQNLGRKRGAPRDRIGGIEACRHPADTHRPFATQIVEDFRQRCVEIKLARPRLFQLRSSLVIRRKSIFLFRFHLSFAVGINTDSGREPSYNKPSSDPQTLLSETKE